MCHYKWPPDRVLVIDEALCPVPNTEQKVLILLLEYCTWRQKESTGRYH